MMMTVMFNDKSSGIVEPNVKENRDKYIHSVMLMDMLHGTRTTVSFKIGRVECHPQLKQRRKSNQ